MSARGACGGPVFQDLRTEAEPEKCASAVAEVDLRLATLQYDEDVRGSIDATAAQKSQVLPV